MDDEVVILEFSVPSSGLIIELPGVFPEREVGVIC
jgi:hypothetical protein